MKQNTIDDCNCCGGQRPCHADSSEHDSYLTRDDGMCTGCLTTDATGMVLGCGAWSAEAYDVQS